MTERTRLISYLLYGLFSAILKKNTIKTPAVIFHIHLRALRFSSSLILKKYLYASFSFSYWKYSCTLFIFSIVFAHVHVVLLTPQKSCRAEKTETDFIMPGHYLTSKEAWAVYYTVIKHDGHLRTRGKCRKRSPAARVFYIYRVFSNDRSVLSQCNNV